MLLATMLYRVSHLTVGVLAILHHQRDQPVHHVALVMALALSVLLYGAALRRGWFESRYI